MVELIRAMTPEERLQRCLEFSAFVRGFVEAGIRAAHPGASEREIFLLGAKRRLGEDLFQRVYGNELENYGSLRGRS